MTGRFAIIGGAALLFSLWIGVLPAFAETKPVAADAAATVWKTLRPGLETARMASASEIRPSFTLRVFRLDLERFRVKAADARTYGENIRAASAREMTRRTGAILAVNASFFDENGRPLGLVISEGKRLNPYRNADWGVLSISRSRAWLFHTKSWTSGHSRATDFALQVGPRIVVDGRSTKLKPQAARRVAVGIPKDRKRLVVAITDSGEAEASDLARLMAAPEARGGLECFEAVLMDGGPSAQLYARSGDFTADIPGGWDVPMGIVFVESSGMNREVKKTSETPPPNPSKEKPQEKSHE